MNWLRAKGLTYQNSAAYLGHIRALGAKMQMDDLQSLLLQIRTGECQLTTDFLQQAVENLNQPGHVMRAISAYYAMVKQGAQPTPAVYRALFTGLRRDATEGASEHLSTLLPAAARLLQHMTGKGIRYIQVLEPEDESTDCMTTGT